MAKRYVYKLEALEDQTNKKIFFCSITRHKELIKEYLDLTGVKLRRMNLNLK